MIKQNISKRKTKGGDPLISTVLIIVFLSTVAVIYDSWQTDFTKKITLTASNDTNRQISSCSDEFGSVYVNIIEGEVVKVFENSKKYVSLTFHKGGGNLSTSFYVSELNFSINEANININGSWNH